MNNFLVVANPLVRQLAMQNCCFVREVCSHRVAAHVFLLASAGEECQVAPVTNTPQGHDLCIRVACWEGHRLPALLTVDIVMLRWARSLPGWVDRFASLVDCGWPVNDV